MPWPIIGWQIISAEQLVSHWLIIDFLKFLYSLINFMYRQMTNVIAAFLLHVIIVCTTIKLNDYTMNVFGLDALQLH
jgi:hypothetical protein